ncbi:MAG: hypothetical protein HQM13_12765 [SAR324 cluster bacterium]|nr:hypothetical protein [SAR324 cluster bacterium]
MSTIPTESFFRVPLSYRFSWRVWSVALAAAFLIHALLIFLLPPFLFPPESIKNTQLTIEFLDINEPVPKLQISVNNPESIERSPTTPGRSTAIDPGTQKSPLIRPSAQKDPFPQEPLENILEESAQTEDSIDPAIFKTTPNLDQVQKIKIEPIPTLKNSLRKEEELQKQSIFKKISKTEQALTDPIQKSPTLPKSLPAPEHSIVQSRVLEQNSETPRIDPDVPELSPQKPLNDLIQEKESEQLSMKLAKAAQKSPLIRKDSANRESSSSDFDLLPKKFENLPLSKSSQLPQAPANSGTQKEVSNKFKTNDETPQITENAETTIISVGTGRNDQNNSNKEKIFQDPEKSNRSLSVLENAGKNTETKTSKVTEKFFTETNFENKSMAIDRKNQAVPFSESKVKEVLPREFHDSNLFTEDYETAQWKKNEINIEKSKEVPEKAVDQTLISPEKGRADRLEKSIEPATENEKPIDSMIDGIKTSSGAEEKNFDEFDLQNEKISTGEENSAKMQESSFSEKYENQVGLEEITERQLKLSRDSKKVAVLQLETSDLDQPKIFNPASDQQSSKILETEMMQNFKQKKPAEPLKRREDRPLTESVENAVVELEAEKKPIQAEDKNDEASDKFIAKHPQEKVSGNQGKTMQDNIEIHSRGRKNQAEIETSTTDGFSAGIQTSQEIALLQTGNKGLIQSKVKNRRQAPLPENYFLNPDQDIQNGRQKSALAAEGRLQGTLSNALGTFNSSTLLKQYGTGKSASSIPPTQIVVGSQNSSGMSYGLNDYNWPYESYMGRWAKALLYSWRNNPPRDYITGRVPSGGNVFVLATLNRKGDLVAYEVTGNENASDLMVTSVLDAVQGATNLPPLPDDLKKGHLEAHFKFIYPSIQQLLKSSKR